MNTDVAMKIKHFLFDREVLFLTSSDVRFVKKKYPSLENIERANYAYVSIH